VRIGPYTASAILIHVDTLRTTCPIHRGAAAVINEELWQQFAPLQYDRLLQLIDDLRQTSCGV